MKHSHSTSDSIRETQSLGDYGKKLSFSHYKSNCLYISSIWTLTTCRTRTSHVSAKSSVVTTPTWRLVARCSTFVPLDRKVINRNSACSYTRAASHPYQLPGSRATHSLIGFLWIVDRFGNRNFRIQSASTGVTSASRLWHLLLSRENHLAFTLTFVCWYRGTVSQTVEKRWRN